MNHFFIQIAKRIYEGNSKYQEIFWSQIFNVNKKKGINDIEVLRERMNKEIEKIREPSIS